jgi:hypothetical protein
MQAIGPVPSIPDRARPAAGGYYRVRAPFPLSWVATALPGLLSGLSGRFIFRTRVKTKFMQA